MDTIKPLSIFADLACPILRAILEFELQSIALIFMKPNEYGDKQNHYLEWLYMIDRRDSREHPLHGRYTGLVQDRIKEIAKAEFDFVTSKL